MSHRILPITDYPGEYVTEGPPGLPGAVPPALGVAAFIGESTQGPLFTPTQVASVGEFEHHFGSVSAGEDTSLALAAQAFFENGGKRLLVVRCNDVTAVTALSTAVHSLRGQSDVSLLAVPGVCDAAVLAGVLAEVEQRDDLFMVLDGPQSEDRVVTITDVRAFRTALGDRPNVAVYTPWVTLDSPAGSRSVPPSGYIAGVIARTDLQRGVFHTPAGLGAFLQGTTGVCHVLDDDDQGPLNTHGVNVIRSFPDAGVVAWGARTLAMTADGNQHLPVRRTVQYVRKAIELGTAWVVGEPHEPELWALVTQWVERFMASLCHQGAFAGVVPSEAYRVQCDGDNNPPDRVANGVLTITVQFAMFRVGAFQTVTIEHSLRPA